MKVTKALEEIKERNQAKELAKQKAAAAVAAAGGGQRSRETTSSGPSGSSASGFLRGLTKSLGLGGKTESPEEVAERLHRELEEDRRAEAEAQAELDRLMHEDKTAEGKQGTIMSAPVERSTTPVLSPPVATKSEVHPESDRTEEEEEEDEVFEALSLIEAEEPVVDKTPAGTASTAIEVQASSTITITQSQLVPPRLATPPRLSDFRMSTTPAGTPPRKAQPVAPPLHDRAEKHERATPATQPKSAPSIERAHDDARSDGSDESDTADEEGEEDEDIDDGIPAAEGTVTQHVKRVPPIKQAMTSVSTLALDY